MEYILLIMLFVTPPNSIKDEDKNTDKDKRVWALQSTTSIELKTREWCYQVADSIERSILKTSTITTRLFCIPKDQKDIQEKPGAAFKSFQFILPDENRQREIDRAIQIPPKKVQPAPKK